MKGAFDKVDREIMEETLELMAINKRLRKRVMEIYEETMSTVKIGEKYTDLFWTKKGARQGCPMSATLFDAYIADLEEEMRKGRTGGVVIGNMKIWKLIYADEIVLLADREEELKEMLRKFKKRIKKKKDGNKHRKDKNTGI